MVFKTSKFRWLIYVYGHVSLNSYIILETSWEVTPRSTHHIKFLTQARPNVLASSQSSGFDLWEWHTAALCDDREYFGASWTHPLSSREASLGLLEVELPFDGTSFTTDDLPVIRFLFFALSAIAHIRTTHGDSGTLAKPVSPTSYN